MGCCFSTPKVKQDQNGLKNQQPQLRSPAPKSNATHEEHRRAPPPPVEEESVKEVLLETPISKHQVPILTAETKTQMPKIQHTAEKFETNCPINKAEEVSEVVSQISETCSMSENFSTTTTATTATASVTEKREDEGTSTRSTREGTQKRNRSQYTVDGNRIGGRERRPISPATIPEPPPEKKIQVSSRPVRRRESVQLRRDPGEGSDRRSRSPSSSRTVCAGTGRSQLKPPGGAGRRLPPAKGVEKENGRVGNHGVPQEESLENPHVSLECFIFL